MLTLPTAGLVFTALVAIDLVPFFVVDHPYALKQREAGDTDFAVLPIGLFVEAEIEGHEIAIIAAEPPP